MPPAAKRQSITRAVSSMGEDERALHQLLVRAFGRAPTDAELASWTAKLEHRMTARAFVQALTFSRAYKANTQVGTKTQSGHFYSPVVDPGTVRAYVDMNRNAGLDALYGIEFPIEEMAEFWHQNADFIAATPFQEAPDGVNRYSYANGPYPYGDAIVLRAMINHFKPRRIVEIGSGYSTACMLDTADHLGCSDLKITCIEPNPERLISILREGDAARIEFHRTGVQEIPLETFSTLNRNDILFIDSSHVLKTGSDVHYELFYILPKLAPGVLVHFHDCRFPMEYSDRQIFLKNYSWNEIYAVRALLMYSNRFRVVFYASLLANTYPKLAAVSAPFNKNPGSAIWIQVQG
jgi:predicted O-methyltransferase YrrM